MSAALAAEPRLMVQSGDRAAVIGISSTGELIATGSAAGVSIWSAQNGRVLCRLPARDATAVAFSPDGKQLAALVAAEGEVAEVPPAQRPETAREIRVRARARAERPSALAVWDLASCGMRRDVPGALVPKTMMKALAGGDVLLWTRRGTMQIAQPFRPGGTSRAVQGVADDIVAVADNGLIRIEADRDRELQIIDTTTGAVDALASYAGASEKNRRGHYSPTAAVSPSGRWIVALSPDDALLTLYDRQTHKAVATVPLHPDEPNPGVPNGMSNVQRASWIGISRDERTVLVAIKLPQAAAAETRGPELQVRTLPDLQLRATVPILGKDYKPMEAPIALDRFVLSADGRHLAFSNTGMAAPVLGVVDAGSAQPSTHHWIYDSGRVDALHWSSAGELLLVNGGGASSAARQGTAESSRAAQFVAHAAYVTRWPLRTGSPVVDLQANGSAFKLALSADGRIAAFSRPVEAALPGGQGFLSEVKEVAGDRTIWQSKPTQLYTTGLALSRDGAMLAILQVERNSKDGIVKVIDIRSGNVLGEVHDTKSVAVRFSGDGQYLIYDDVGYRKSHVVPLTGKARYTAFALPGTSSDWLGPMSGNSPSWLVSGALASGGAHSIMAEAGDFSVPVVGIPASQPGGVTAMDAGATRVAVSGPAGGKRVIEIYSLQDGMVTSARPSELEGAAGSGVSAMSFSPDARLLAVANTDGTTTLWDLARKAWIAKLYVFGDGTWVSADPEGRFDTNRLEDIRQLHWVLPDEPLRTWPLEIFMRQYYEPRLLPRLLAGEALPPVRALDQINRAQPRVKITSITPGGNGRVGVVVEVAATPDARGRSGGVHNLRLFRAGQLVGHQPAVPGPVVVDRNGTARVRFDDIRLPTTPGPVDFSAYAFNADGVKSETAYASYEVPAGTHAQARRAYLVAIGVSAYENADWNLQFAANDAQSMLKILAERIRKTKRYDEVVETPLIAAHAGDRQATRAQIQAVLRKLAGQPADEAVLAEIPAAAALRPATPDDMVIVTFAGHGYVGTGGRFHLLPSDIGSGRGRDVTPALQAHSVSSEDLEQWLAELDAGQIAMVIDACYSAAVVQADGFKPGPMGSRGLGQLAYDKGIRILAASQADNVAIESGASQHGLLTQALLNDGIEAGRADSQPIDKRIDLAEWLAYGTRRVPELYDEILSGKITVAGAGGRGAAPTGLGQIGQRAAGRSGSQQPELFDFTRKGNSPTIVNLEVGQ